MKAVEIIDKKINDLREVRRIVVKGERRFSKDKEMDKAESFMLTLLEHGIPYSTFEFGTGLFVKIEDVQDTIENNIEVLENSITE